MSAPDRIWLNPDACFGRSKSTAVSNAITKDRSRVYDSDVEYIRADLHDAALAAALAEGMQAAADLARRLVSDTERAIEREKLTIPQTRAMTMVRDTAATLEAAIRAAAGAQP